LQEYVGEYSIGKKEEESQEGYEEEGQKSGQETRSQT